MYQQCLQASIQQAPYFSDHYFTLGRFYIDNNLKDEGRHLLKLGLKNIRYIYPDQNPITDVTDLEEFYNWAIRGIHATRMTLNGIINFL